MVPEYPALQVHCPVESQVVPEAPIGSQLQAVQVSESNYQLSKHSLQEAPV